MLKEQAGSHQATALYLEDQYRDIVRDMYQTIHTSGLDKFTFAWIDSLWSDLSAALYELERLPEAVFKELLEVIEGLTEARNELRLACFLFGVEEINPIYRLIMRNRAVLRGNHLLQRVIWNWPRHFSSGTSKVDPGKSFDIPPG
jgi:hypothetical protein